MGSVTLDDLIQSTERVERGEPIPEYLRETIQHGTSICGARPKAFIDGEQHKYIAKFSSSSDIQDMIRGEFLSMRLALHCGLDVAPVHISQAMGKDVLMVDRFDREPLPNGWQRLGAQAPTLCTDSSSTYRDDLTLCQLSECC